MVLLPDTYNCGLRKRRECRERFPRHRGLALILLLLHHNLFHNAPQSYDCHVNKNLLAYFSDSTTALHDL